MDWLRTDMVCVALDRTPNSVRVIAHRHNWETLRIGRDAYYAKGDVKRYLDNQNHN